MEIVQIILSASITILSLGLFIVSLLSYKTYKNGKLLFVSGVFFLFFLQGTFFSLGLFSSMFAGFILTIPSSLFDLVILVVLFIATLKR